MAVLPNCQVMMNHIFTKYLLLFITTFLILTAKYTFSQVSADVSTTADSVQTQFKEDIIKASGDSLKLLTIYADYGEYLDKNGDWEAAIQQFLIALRIAKNTNTPKEIASAANWLANLYAQSGDFKMSTDYYTTALQSAEETQNSGEIAKISMNLASNYNFTGDYDKAIKFGLYALKTKETTNNLERICYHYIAMGNIFRENNNTMKWEEYVQKAYKMKDIDGCASFSDVAKIYNSLGGIAVKKSEFEKGLSYYDTLLNLSLEANYNQGISTALTNSAGIYKQLDNYPKALEMATEAEQYFGENPYDKIFNKNFKAEIYNLTGEYKKGLELAKSNIETEEINYYSTEKLKCLELLYELNFNISNYDEAFFWNDSLRTTESVLRDEDIRQSMEELETQYETEKKEQQIALLTTENQLKNQRIKAGIGLVVILLLVIFLIVYILTIRKKQAALAQNDLQQQVLRAQMNPHFIFNVLGSIQNFMMQNDTRKASGYLSQFASLTRATLNNSVAETISLADEISMLKNYIELEKMRKGNLFDYEIQFDEDLEVDFIQIPPMLIQPFVENSMKHGFKNLTRKGHLKLSILDKTDWVEFIIEDNGNGIQENKKKPQKHQSMAMAIFEKRRKLIQQKHNKDFNFEVVNLKDINPDSSGTRIRIDLPII